MYESFYGLREKPFNLTPDPRFLYLSEMHKEAFAHLIFGIRNRVGFIMVTGEIGTGKTTICRSLLGQLDQDVELAFIFNPCLSPEELLRKINEDFGIRSRAISVKGLIDELNTYLLDRHAKNKNCVLVIDEAQNLTPPVLEQIRLLSNLETERQKLLQIVLIGQPELAEHLELPELRQLNQRITARYHLKPLGEKETLQYIAYRLRVAGGMRKVRFTRGAIKCVYRHSKGTPRVINAICDRALLIGYSKETPEISRALVKQAAREIRGERVRTKKKGALLSRYVPTPRLVAAAALIVLVGLFIVRPVAKRLDTLVALLQNPPAAGQAAPVEAANAPDESNGPDQPAETPGETTPSVPPEPAERKITGEAAPVPPEPAAAVEASTGEAAPVPPEPAAAVTNVDEPAPAALEPPAAPEHGGSTAPVSPEAGTDSEAPTAEDVFPGKAPGVFDAIALVASVVPGDPPVTDEPSTPVPAAESSAPAETGAGDAGTPPAAEIAAVEPSVPQSFEARLQALDPGESLKAAASSLLRAWNMALLSDVPAGDGVKDLVAFASAYGLTGESLPAGLPELEALNLPAFVRMGSGEKQLWLALLSTEAGSVRCSMHLGEEIEVSREEFGQAYRTESVVLWRDPAPGAETLKPDMKGDQVRALQHRLRQLGRYRGDLTGVYDAATAEAVAGIQAETALTRDGKAGQQVRMVLSSWLDGIPTPELHAMDRPVAVQTASDAPTEPVSAPPETAQAEAPTPAPLPAPGPAPELDLPEPQKSDTTEVAGAGVEPLPAEMPEAAGDAVAADSPRSEAPLVTVVELPKEPAAAPPVPGRDVEALLAEEVYGQNAGETGKEVTSPVVTGAPLVPHQGTTTEPADGESG